MSIPTQVKSTIKRYQMLEPGDKVLVGVSGGPDSVALLLVLASLRKELPLDLHIAHLNHRLRGKESDQDEKFVCQQAQKLKLPVTCDKINGPALIRKKGVSEEETLRQERYRFLEETARAIGAKKIALGHSRDDQAETILMRIIRGSGLAGLSGIPAVRETDGAAIVRPLINCWRKEIEAYLRRRKINWRFDSSNRDLKFLRNRIRLKLIPYLEKEYKPGIKQVLATLAENSAADYAYLTGRARRAYRRILSSKEETEVRIDRKKFLSKDIALRKEIFRQALKELKGDLRGVAFRHWQELYDLICTASGTKGIDLPGGSRAEVNPKEVVLLRKKNGGVSSHLRKTYPLRVPGIVRIPEASLRVSCRIENTGRLVKSRSKWKESFDLDKIKPPLSLRFRRAGDRIRPLGIKQHKKLQDLFVDEKIPVSERGKTPLILARDNEIIWVVGVRMADAVKVSDATRAILKISVSANRKTTRSRHQPGKG